MKRKLYWEKEELSKAVKENTTIANVLRDLGLSGCGSYTTIHKYVRIYNLDTSHWTGQGHLKGKKRNLRKASLEEVFSN